MSSFAYIIMATTCRLFCLFQFEISCQFGALHLLLSPRQLHGLLELFAGISSPGKLSRRHKPVAALSLYCPTLRAILMSFVAFSTVFQSYQDNKERLCTRQFHLQRKDFGSKWDFNPVLLAQQGYCSTKASCLESIGKHIVNLKL